MGGGIPSSLKTDMNAVLNKKFGTSTTYAPDTWAPNVNLLGPLPEKTVSGAIAHIEDGADTVPIKSWDVTVGANLGGVSSVEVTQAGKNLFGLVPYQATAYNLPAKSDCMFIKKGTYTFSFDEISDSNTVSTSWRYVVTVYDESGNLPDDLTLANNIMWRGTLSSYASPANSTAKSITLTFAIDCYIFIRFWSGDTTSNMTMKQPQLEAGSTASTYAAYTAPTVTTVSLGRTIYGGNADVVNGTGTDENGNDFTFTPISPTPQTPLGTSNFWADTGDSEVTYRADIDLIINALNNNRGLMMRPINTEEIEFEEEENSDESQR